MEIRSSAGRGASLRPTHCLEEEEVPFLKIRKKEIKKSKFILIEDQFNLPLPNKRAIFISNALHPPYFSLLSWAAVVD